MQLQLPISLDLLILLLMGEGPAGPLIEKFWLVQGNFQSLWPALISITCNQMQPESTQVITCLLENSMLCNLLLKGLTENRISCKCNLNPQPPGAPQHKKSKIINSIWFIFFNRPFNSILFFFTKLLI